MVPINTMENITIEAKDSNQKLLKEFLRLPIPGHSIC
jgi:hypothetical protein